MKHFLEEKDSEEKEQEEESGDHEKISLSILSESPDLRITGLYGEVTEEKCSELIYNMLHLKESGRKEVEGEGSEKAIVYDPFEFVISTEGGSASDMFAVYDIMRMIKGECDIKTFGIGKVMSAGVLLLAAGTTGKRRIGKNCRVMLHPVKAGHVGYVHEIQNELSHAQWIQDRYIQCIVDESSLSLRELKKIINKKTNVYIDAEQAVKYGIADIIV